VQQQLYLQQLYACMLQQWLGFVAQGGSRHMLCWYVGSILRVQQLAYLSMCAETLCCATGWVLGQCSFEQVLVSAMSLGCMPLLSGVVVCRTCTNLVVLHAVLLWLEHCQALLALLCRCATAAAATFCCARARVPIWSALKSSSVF
jgi:hypothetical protein